MSEGKPFELDNEKKKKKKKKRAWTGGGREVLAA